MSAEQSYERLHSLPEGCRLYVSNNNLSSNHGCTWFSIIGEQRARSLCVSYVCEDRYGRNYCHQFQKAQDASPTALWLSHPSLLIKIHVCSFRHRTRGEVVHAYSIGGRSPIGIDRLVIPNMFMTPYRFIYTTPFGIH